jgi:uncharacterized membrane protein (DUF2068 family)
MARATVRTDQARNSYRRLTGSELRVPVDTSGERLPYWDFLRKSPRQVVSLSPATRHRAALAASFPVNHPKTRTAATKTLRFIAITKLVKGILVVAIGLGAFRLINRDLAEYARSLTTHLRIDPENHYARRFIEKVAKINAAHLRDYGVVSFVFAAELFTEGIGLWLNQNWAKYMVLLGTGFFIPFEAYACVRHFTWEHLLLFVLNVAIVIYVAIVVRRERHHEAPPG